MRSICKTAPAVVVGGLLLAGTAVAGPGPEGRGWGGPGGRSFMMERAVSAAELSAESEARVLAILASGHEAKRGDRDRMGGLRGALEDYLASDIRDGAEIEGLVDAIVTEHADAMRSRLMTLVEVRGAVSADEWARLREVLRHKPGRGPGHRFSH